MPSVKKISVLLTPRQLAAAEEACDSYPATIEIPAMQVRATEQAAEHLRAAFKESKELWPW